MKYFRFYFDGIRKTPRGARYCGGNADYVAENELSAGDVIEIQQRIREGQGIEVAQITGMTEITRAMYLAAIEKKKAKSDESSPD